MRIISSFEPSIRLKEHIYSPAFAFFRLKSYVLVVLAAFHVLLLRVCVVQESAVTYGSKNMKVVAPETTQKYFQPTLWSFINRGIRDIHPLRDMRVLVADLCYRVVYLKKDLLEENANPASSTLL